MACEQTGDHSLPYSTKDPSSDVVVAGWPVRFLDFLAGNMSHLRVILLCSAKHLDSSGELPTSVAGNLSCVPPGVFNQRGHAKPVNLLVNRVRLLALLIAHS